jgi:DHA2 family multidrug resistance protein
MTYVTSDWDFWELLWPQIFRGIGLMCAIIPVTNTALGTLPMERVKNASGLFNLMRNLGGAIGLAAINTWFNDRMDLHLQRLHDSVNSASIPATEMLSTLASRFQGSDAQSQALQALTSMVRMQAAVMSYADVFLLLTAIFIVIAAFGLLMKRPQPVAAAAGH